MSPHLSPSENEEEYQAEEKQTFPPSRKISEKHEAIIEELQYKLDTGRSQQSQQKLLLLIGGVLAATLLINLIADWTAYTAITVILLKILSLLEASLPLAVSFFLKNPKHALILRVLGIFLLVSYIFTILWLGFLGGI